MCKLYLKMISFCLSTLLLFSSLTVNSNAQNIDLVAQTAIAMEASTGEVLYSKNAGKKMYPASTTKAWTAYLVIKYIDNIDKKITVTEDLSWVEPTSMYLKVGESFTVRELLEVLMLKSANDVAVLLAKEISGSVEAFAELMNKEAKLLGCTNTNFVNPNGLPDENHYSTAYDMALIGRECVRSEVLMDVVSTERISLPANEFYPHERHYTNSNKFLTSKDKMEYKGELVDYKYNIVDGLKTGYTKDAGRCLLTTAKVGDTRVIVGIFNSQGNNVYTDARTLIDYSIENYRTTVVLDANEIYPELEKKISFSKEKKVNGYLKESYTVLDKINKNQRSLIQNYDEQYSYKIKMNRLSNTISKNDVIGSVEIYKDKEKVETLDIYAKDSVNPILDKEQILLLIVGFGLIGFISIRKFKRTKEEERKRVTRSSRNIYIRARSKNATINKTRKRRK